MAQHDFTALFAHYPSIIDQMMSTFNSHQFILRLAQQHQLLYVEALYSYRHTIYQSTPAPFMNVHRELSQGLRKYPHLIEYAGDVPSTDMFGQANRCAQWRKV